MQNNKLKLNVFMDIGRNEKGITFISMLLTLSIIFITLPFVVHFLHYTHSTTYHEDISVHQFFHFLQQDVLEANHVYSRDNTLHFYLKSDETAKIEIYSNMIRRQVEGRGHEIYLRDVASWIIEPLGYGSKIIVNTLKGDRYEKTITHYDE